MTLEHVKCRNCKELNISSSFVQNMAGCSQLHPQPQACIAGNHCWGDFMPSRLTARKSSEHKVATGVLEKRLLIGRCPPKRKYSFIQAASSNGASISPPWIVPDARYAVGGAFVKC